MDKSSITVGVAIGWLLLVTSPTPAQQPDELPVKFQRDIRPIFVKHCLKCHSEEDPQGGLSLSDHSHAVIGGNSGQSILQATRDTNPLFERITSEEESFRMPQEAPPLSAEEIELIGRWIDQGAVWDENDIFDPVQDEPALELTLTERMSHYLVVYPYLLKLGLIGIGLLCAAALLQKMRSELTAQAGWTQGVLQRPVRWVTTIGYGHLAAVFLLVTLWFVWNDFQIKLDAAGVSTAPTSARVEDDQATRYKNAYEKYKKLHDQATRHPTMEELYGKPPRPHHPRQPPKLSSVYYRGNCERNPALFNGGNYLTAKLYLDLCDSQRQILKYGDKPGAGPLLIRCEIERAPKTAESFFTPQRMSQLFLTTHTLSFPAEEESPPPPVAFETLEEKQRWVAYFPIGEVDADSEAQKLSGLVYLTVGPKKKETVNGLPHYGLRYDLKFEAGKILEGSDLWMGELFLSPQIFTPLSGKVPLNEWFDNYPIPEITGENSQDPKLLGITPEPKTPPAEE